MAVGQDQVVCIRGSMGHGKRHLGGRLGVFAELGPKWATEDLQDVFYQTFEALV